MKTPLCVLMVDGSEDDVALVLQNLKSGGYDPDVKRVETAEDMEAALDERLWDLVLCDDCMPKLSTTHALDVLRRKKIDIPFIIVSSTIGEEVAVAMMKAGAHDYVMKDNLARLCVAIERELREVGVRRDRRRVEEKIKKMSFYDVLTGLPNRSLFHDRLRQALLVGDRQERIIAVLLIDLDRFKEINDTLGYQHGDIVLQQVGKRIQGLLRKSDTVAHLGGDEYGVLLSETGEEGAILTVKKILKAFEEPILLENLPVSIEASIGIALFPNHGKDAETLLRRVNVAMYVAKQAGHRHMVYTPCFDQTSPFRLTLISELRTAIDANHLFLVYQPKIDLKSGCVVGVEALVRWQHHTRGIIYPDTFITLSERTGLIKALTQWVVNTAVHQCQAWNEANYPLIIIVNLSARNLNDPELPDRISQVLQSSGLPPDRLVLEITESAIMIDLVRAMEILNRLRALGIRLSIDDFGTGYSSLSYLKKLPVDELKIDMSFVKDMILNEEDAVIVQSTIDLAHNLGLKVVAEGVENKETWDRLVEMGCDAAQGYYMSHPVRNELLIRWLEESPWGLGKNAA
ncbi:GGDEF domain-containing response regulator [Nitrospira defluvii]|nr:GGDEF domain-containing response regulator [Nitrospira defluvii]